MKKKAIGKKPARSKSRPAKAKPAKAVKTKPPAKGEAKSPALASKAKAKPKVSQAPAPKTRTKTVAKPAAKSGKKAKAKPAAKRATKTGAKPAPKAAAKAKVAPKLREAAGRDTELILAPELIAKTLTETVPAEDEGALRNVMSSLTALFGGRDDLSDAELDALLDSKIASGEIPPSAALDPLDEAQSLIYEAWNSEGPQRVRLARKALEISPDCADAYVIIAEEDAEDKLAAIELFRKGVEAGERAMGPEVFRKSVGRFWDVMETRPYMRARLGLAECLWEQGGKEEAIGHLRELLRLNPADNQGVRLILAQWQP